MLQAKKALNPIQLPTVAANQYNPPVRGKFIIKSAVFMNSNAAARTITVYLVPAGGTAGADNAIVSSKTLAPNETWRCDAMENQVLNGHATTLASGDSLQAIASAATSVTMHVSGVEVWDVP